MQGTKITAEFRGVWGDPIKGKQTTCWNLTDDVGRYWAGSTVSSVTLERQGFFVPEQSEKDGFEVGKFYVLEQV